MDGAWQQEANAAQIAEFLKMLAVCHTVLPEGGETPSAIKYQVITCLISGELATFLVPICSCTAEYYLKTGKKTFHI